MDKELLEALRQVVREEVEPMLDKKLAPIKATQKQILGKIEYLSGVVEETIVLHDEVEERVKVLESNAL